MHFSGALDPKALRLDLRLPEHGGPSAVLYGLTQPAPPDIGPVRVQKYDYPHNQRSNESSRTTFLFQEQEFTKISRRAKWQIAFTNRLRLQTSEHGK